MIEGICEDLTGVQKAEVNARQRQLVVEHEPTVTASDIVAAVTAGGYPIEQRPE